MNDHDDVLRCNKMFTTRQLDYHHNQYLLQDLLPYKINLGAFSICISFRYLCNLFIVNNNINKHIRSMYAPVCPCNRLELTCINSPQTAILSMLNTVNKWHDQYLWLKWFNAHINDIIDNTVTSIGTINQHQS